MICSLLASSEQWTNGVCHLQRGLGLPSHAIALAKADDPGVKRSATLKMNMLGLRLPLFRNFSFFKDARSI